MMKSFFRFRSILRLLPAALLLMTAACLQTSPPAPPPDPGRIIARHSHSFYSFDIHYSVGLRDNQVRVLGTISNALPTDLDRVMVSVTVKNDAGRILAKGHSPFFDVTDMESETFIIDLPLLHGPCVFEFTCEYLNLDDSESRRRRFLGGETDWNNFTDRINLP